VVVLALVVAAAEVADLDADDRAGQPARRALGLCRRRVAVSNFGAQPPRLDVERVHPRAADGLVPALGLLGQRVPLWPLPRRLGRPIEVLAVFDDPVQLCWI